MDNVFITDKPVMKLKNWILLIEIHKKKLPSRCAYRICEKLSVNEDIRMVAKQKPVVTFQTLKKEKKNVDYYLMSARGKIWSATSIVTFCLPNFRNQKKRKRDWPDDSHSDEDLFEPEPIRLYIRNAQTNNPQVSLNSEVITGPVVPNQVLHLTGQNAEPKQAGRHEFKRI